LSDLLPEPLVIFPRPILPSLYDAIVALYHAEGRVPVVAQEAIQMQTIVNLVSADLGLAWVPASVQQFQRPGVVYRKLGGKAALAPVCETSLVWGAAVPPALARWIDFVAQEVRDGIPSG
jgi:DNA-binding transcriptional LysR family regulator